jgi:hypothetical protein
LAVPLIKGDVRKDWGINWIIFLSYCFVISKRRKGRRKKFSPFSSLTPSPSPIGRRELHHMLDNFRNKDFIFFFCVLFIEDTIIFSYQSSTHKRILRPFTFCTVN